MKSGPGLGQRILRWLLGYAVAVSVVVAAGGYVIHERVERLAWDSLLRAELGYYARRAQADPDFRWRDTETLRLFGTRHTRPLPPSLAALPEGLHDDRVIDGVHSVVLRDRVDGMPVALALDLTGFDGVEGAVILAVAGSTIVLVLLIGLLVMWRLGRVVEPLTNVARQVAGLQPGEGGRQVTVDPQAGVELRVIAESFNEYHDRTRAYLDRERAFIATVNHELRTPISVIGGAAGLLVAQPGLDAAAAAQAARIARTAGEMEGLVALLLVLARDPQRLGDMSETVELQPLLAQLVEDHRHLAVGKDLALRLDAVAPCAVVAPPAILQSAIGNLLRNAIEHSDSGEIRVRLLADATVVIEDPGHGMSPEQVSAIYGRLARGGTPADTAAGDPLGGGIGIDLIARVCEHLGWRLELESSLGDGTTTTLELHPRGALGGSSLSGGQ